MQKLASVVRALSVRHMTRESELAKKQEVEIRAQIDRDIAEVGVQAERDAVALEETIGKRKAQAVTFVVESVVGA